jgi:hypothetical protein
MSDPSRPIRCLVMKMSALEIEAGIARGTAKPISADDSGTGRSRVNEVNLFKPARGA